MVYTTSIRSHSLQQVDQAGLDQVEAVTDRSVAAILLIHIMEEEACHLVSEEVGMVDQEEEAVPMAEVGVHCQEEFRHRDQVMVDLEAAVEVAAVEEVVAQEEAQGTSQEAIEGILDRYTRS